MPKFYPRNRDAVGDMQLGFDSGNSLFWQNPRMPDYDDLTNIGVNSFRKTERQLLRLVGNRAQLDLSKLPTEDELRSIYRMDPLIPYVDAIIRGYRKKKELPVAPAAFQ